MARKYQRKNEQDPADLDIVCVNMYGPNGVKVNQLIGWIGENADRLYDLSLVIRPDELRLLDDMGRIEQLHRVQYLNRAVEDVMNLVEELYLNDQKRETEQYQKFQDLIEAMVQETILDM